MSRSTTVQATVMQAPAIDQFEVLNDVLITVEDGVITAIAPAASFAGTVDHVVEPGSVLMPGLIDLHIHAPQWPQVGTGYDLPLEEWLFAYTFPLEAKYSDLSFAIDVWDSMVPRLLANGTTTAVYYGSVHGPATTALAEACVRHGQRAFVGRVAMDHPDGTPEWYRDATTEAGLEASAESIESINGLGSPLVAPIVTPRFIPACTDEMLTGLGQLAADTGTLVQTHCSESDWEHGYVLDRFGATDAEALDRFGLLQTSTVLAHAGHLTTNDLHRLAHRHSGVAHCPLSNVYFGNAVFAARRALDAGVNVGLGTDIAGGPSPSLFANAAQAVNASRLLEDGVDANIEAAQRGVAGSRIDALAGFWLATMGGAAVLNQPIGLLEVGRRFDAIEVTTERIGVWAEVDSPVRIFEKIVRMANEADISRVWVDGDVKRR